MVRRILSRIAENAPERRGKAIAELLILARLRSLGSAVEREIEQMPILDDIRDHDVIGPWIAKGERTIILAQIARRFGSVPEWAAQKLESFSPAELEKLAMRLLDASTLEELFG